MTKNDQKNIFAIKNDKSIYRKIRSLVRINRRKHKSNKFRNLSELNLFILINFRAWHLKLDSFLEI